MGIISSLLGIPLVYDRLRPAIVGGIDRSGFYALAGIRSGDVVLDIGCGTGDALDRLPRDINYFGFDTDPAAIEAARQRHGLMGREAVLENRVLTPDDVASIGATVAILGGLLHHLDDRAAHDLLEMLAASPSLRAVIALDVTYLQGRPFNNLMTLLDRGRFARRGADYVALAEGAGWRVASAGPLPAAPGNARVVYWAMRLEPSSESASRS